MCVKVIIWGRGLAHVYAWLCLKLHIKMVNSGYSRDSNWVAGEQGRCNFLLWTLLDLLNFLLCTYTPYSDNFLERQMQTFKQHLRPFTLGTDNLTKLCNPRAPLFYRQEGCIWLDSPNDDRDCLPASSSNCKSLEGRESLFTIPSPGHIAHSLVLSRPVFTEHRKMY